MADIPAVNSLSIIRDLFLFHPKKGVYLCGND
jgi:hypothetical protein